MRKYLFVSAIFLASTSAYAQEVASTQPQQEDQGDEEIIVTGERPRGSAIGDIKAELTLEGGDIRALGVGSVTEILAELAPQISGTGGKPPLILLEGHRVSGPQEIRKLPSEAIARVDILPEQVALKYGYPSDQKVVNFVLRKRFRAWTLEGKSRFATEGGAYQGNGSASYFSVRNGARFNMSTEYTGTEMLTEAEREIFDTNGLDTGRSAIASEQEFTLNMGYSRPLADRLSGSINGELTTDRTRALLGADKPRTVSGQSARIGTTINFDGQRWRGTWTTSLNHDEARTIASIQGVSQPADQARSNNDVLESDLTMNGSPFSLPAGDASLTARIGGSISSFASSSTRSLAGPTPALHRSLGLGALSVDLPVLDSPSPWIGKLSVNGNVKVQTLSDFGTVRGFGGGITWGPVKSVSFVASYKDEESAPTVQQLGDPLLSNGSVRVFDYVKGVSAQVQYQTGGNLSLEKADVREWRLGLNIRALDKPNLTFSLDYTGMRTDNGIVALPAVTTASEAAFPGRYRRDALGNLIFVDARFVNIAHQRSDVLRWGINFSKTLKTPQAQVDAMRAYMAKRFAANGGGAPGAQGAGAPAGPPIGRGGFGRGGGGRMSFSLYHSIHLAERATLIDGQSEIDLLNGGTLNGGAPQSRHKVEVTAGYSRGWLGARLTGNWQSSSHVRDLGGSSSGDLRFGDLATVNLRMFMNMGQMPSLLNKHPFLFGTRISLGVTNIFNTRQKVTDGIGITPPAYSPALLDPLGRTITISLRKSLF